MSDAKFIITHDGDVLRQELSCKDAILFAARYDGWGADFLRDEQGVMALRRSSRHIGNNEWLATGDEAALFGIVSVIEDDDDAVEEVVKKLLPQIEKLHKLLTVQDVDEYIRDRLRFSLDQYLQDHEGETGPGEWVVDTASRGCSSSWQPALCYKWPEMTEDHPNWGDIDAPWKKWGGDEIIESAGCVHVNGTMDDGVDCAMVALRPTESHIPVTHVSPSRPRN